MDELLFLKLYFLFNVQCQSIEHLRNNCSPEVLKLNNEYYKSILSTDLQQYARIWFKEILSDEVIENVNKLENKYRIIANKRTILRKIYVPPKTVLRLLK